LKKKKAKQKGADFFHEWYQAHWGDRWSILRQALEEPVQHVLWWNPLCSLDKETIFAETLRPVESFPNCYHLPSELPEAVPVDEKGIEGYYLLDGGSVLAAIALDVQPGDQVLDLCAAPGGKSLQLFSRLGTEGSLISNDLSRNRRGRLRRVLDGFIPEGAQGQVKLTGHDATRWCLYEKEKYDRILLDAPCSSERHLLDDPKFLTSWSPARSRQLAQRQYAMLVSALDVVRVGGRIVYSTCSISPLECDGILQKLLKKRKGRFEMIFLDFPYCERTDLGYYILPDKSNWGPIYFSVLERTS